jgi:hypothetical protein
VSPIRRDRRDERWRNFLDVATTPSLIEKWKLLAFEFLQQLLRDSQRLRALKFLAESPPELVELHAQLHRS